MSNRAQNFSTTTLTNAAESAANTETVVATLAGISSEFDGMTLRFEGWLKCACPASLTSGLLRIRRDSLTGSVISDTNVENVQFVASKTCQSTVFADDVGRTPCIATYVMTYVGAGEATACTFDACKLACRIF